MDFNSKKRAYYNLIFVHRIVDKSDWQTLLSYDSSDNFVQSIWLFSIKTSIWIRKVKFQTAYDKLSHVTYHDSPKQQLLIAATSRHLSNCQNRIKVKRLWYLRRTSGCLSPRNILRVRWLPCGTKTPLYTNQCAISVPQLRAQLKRLVGPLITFNVKVGAQSIVPKHYGSHSIVFVLSQEFNDRFVGQLHLMKLLEKCMVQTADIIFVISLLWRLMWGAFLVAFIIMLTLKWIYLNCSFVLTILVHKNVTLVIKHVVQKFKD